MAFFSVHLAEESVSQVHTYAAMNVNYPTVYQFTN